MVEGSQPLPFQEMNLQQTSSVLPLTLCYILQIDVRIDRFWKFQHTDGVLNDFELVNHLIYLFSSKLLTSFCLAS